MNILNAILNQLFKTSFWLPLLIFCIIWIISFYKSTKIEKIFYPKELTFVSEALKTISIFLIFILIPSYTIGIINIGPSESTESVVVETQWVLIISGFITLLILIISFLLIEAEQNKNIIEKLTLLHNINHKWVKIILSIVSILLVLFTFGKFLNYSILVVMETEKIKAASTNFLHLFLKLGKELGKESLYAILALLLLIILTCGFFVYKTILYFFNYIVLTVFYFEEIKGTVYLKSGTKICDVYVYNPPIGKYIFVGNNMKESYATQKLAIKKEEIEFIHFVRKINNYQEKNPIIIITPRKK
ncbi:hypothetical protein DV713_01790 [Parageobacillus thermoglucosidasius]|uniref:hypothetical protein n=1 Tax=Parageobacillus thermoglucosidasius TaxID=1426 RepID=UPI000E121EF2|nr:hypothetical protein [Parageobacillus thermoglucosidasius]RDE36340.1 hypothetical protein DV713_01790 [Parageobacillus thermoglucosidasius]